MTQNQSFANQYYTINYSDNSKLKIAEIQSTIPLTQLDEIQDIVMENITFHMPQLAREVPYYNLEYISNLKKIAKSLSKKFKNIVVVGMGGGILNGMCLNNFVDRNDINIIFSTKICASYLSKIKISIDLEKTAFIFISNSGDTVETVVSADYWYRVLLSQQITDCSNRFIFIYGQKETSLLKDLHTTYDGIFLPYDGEMGGRFSTFTTPHLLIALLSGIDIDQCFDGANELLNEFKTHTLQNTLFSGVFFTTCNLNQSNSTGILVGSYNLELYGLTKWYHTAIAEIFGREEINISTIHLDLPVDQHGLMQALLNNNTEQIFNLFSIKNSIDNNISVVQKIMQSEVVDQFSKRGIATREFVFENTSAQTLGRVMMYLILELITTATFMKINPFIQPQIDRMKMNIAKEYRKYIQRVP